MLNKYDIFAYFKDRYASTMATFSKKKFQSSFSKVKIMHVTLFLIIVMLFDDVAITLYVFFGLRHSNKHPTIVILSKELLQFLWFSTSTNNKLFLWLATLQVKDIYKEVDQPVEEMEKDNKDNHDRRVDDTETNKERVMLPRNHSRTACAYN